MPSGMRHASRSDCRARGRAMLSRLRIGPKLLLAPGVVLILLVLLSCGAYYAMVRQNQSLEIIVQQRAAHIRAASDLVFVGAPGPHRNLPAADLACAPASRAPRIDALARDIHARHREIQRQVPPACRCHAGWQRRTPLHRRGRPPRTGCMSRRCCDVIELARDDRRSAPTRWSRPNARSTWWRCAWASCCASSRQLSEAASQQRRQRFPRHLDR